SSRRRLTTCLPASILVAPHALPMRALFGWQGRGEGRRRATAYAWHEEATAALQQLAVTDGLTGLLNRRGAMEQAELAFAMARRHHEPLAVILLDLDHFKRINDTLGHETGDKVLQLTAEQLRLSLRQTDLSCRWGGEEFLVVLRHCDQKQAVEVDARLRTLLQRAGQMQLSSPVSFSSGLALLQDANTDLDALLRRADTALYEAKRSGRGRLCISATG
uniref:GGDEF domain-containing protein n=1 Tax=Azohydromonas aeria TaxID=2590212 RepID=UPI001E623EE5